LTGDKEVTTSARTNRRAVVERKLMEYEEMKRNQSWPYNPQWSQLKYRGFTAWLGQRSKCSM